MKFNVDDVITGNKCEHAPHYGLVGVVKNTFNTFGLSVLVVKITQKSPSYTGNKFVDDIISGTDPRYWDTFAP